MPCHANVGLLCLASHQRAAFQLAEHVVERGPTEGDCIQLVEAGRQPAPDEL
jgi:hypothetical protein